MTVPHNALLDLDPGVAQVQFMVRYDVISNYDEVIGSVKPDAPTNVDVNTDGTAKRSLQGFTCRQSDLDAIDLYNERLRPTFVYEDGSEWPVGAFYFTDAVQDDSTWAPQGAVQLVDGDSLFDAQFIQTFSVGEGGSIVRAVNDIFDQAGVLNRTIPDSGSTIGADGVVWARKSPMRDAINYLCVLCGWLPPYFDNRGAAVIRSLPNLDDQDPDHVYSRDDRRVLFAPPGGNGGIRTNSHLLTAPNLHVVTCSGPTAGEITAQAFVDPNLPFSRENRHGRVLAEFHDMQGIVSTEQAQQIANRFAQVDAQSFTTVDFESTPDPRHDMFDVVNWNGDNYREQAWSLPLAPGTNVRMAHSLARSGFNS